MRTQTNTIIISEQDSDEDPDKYEDSDEDPDKYDKYLGEDFNEVTA